MAGDSENANSSEPDSEELLSDNPKNTSEAYTVVQSKKKRKYNSSSGAGSTLLHAGSDDEPVDYDSLDSDQKLSMILSKVTLYEARFKGLETVFGSVKKQGKRLSEVESVVKSYDDRVRLLEYKTIDLEARSRRNNILFFGISESRNENCKNVIADFLLAHLNTRITEADINRTHRVGRFDSRKKRPIIVAFQSYALVEAIMKDGRLLKDTEYSISRDYPLEITRARKTLWPDFKRTKTQNPSAKVSIGYPAKIIVNGVVTLDLFPEWDDIIYGSRIDIRHPSQESYARKQRFAFLLPFGASQSTPIQGVSGDQGRAGREPGSPTEMETDAAAVVRGNIHDSFSQGRSESVTDAKEVTQTHQQSDSSSGVHVVPVLTSKHPTLSVVRNIRVNMAREPGPVRRQCQDLGRGLGQCRTLDRQIRTNHRYKPQVRSRLTVYHRVSGGQTRTLTI